MPCGPPLCGIFWGHIANMGGGGGQTSFKIGVLVPRVGQGGQKGQRLSARVRAWRT